MADFLGGEGVVQSCEVGVELLLRRDLKKIPRDQLRRVGPILGGQALGGRFIDRDEYNAQYRRQLVKRELVARIAGIVTEGTRQRGGGVVDDLLRQNDQRYHIVREDGQGRAGWNDLLNPIGRIACREDLQRFGGLHDLF